MLIKSKVCHDPKSIPKLIQEVGALHKPGEITERTVLNVFGPMGHGGRYILDSLKTGAVDKSCYTDADLTIGAKINVWGREVTICDMDEFTAHHYSSKFNVGMCHLCFFCDFCCIGLPI